MITNPLSFTNDPIWVNIKSIIKGNKIIFENDNKIICQEDYYLSSKPYICNNDLDSISVLYYGTIEIPKVYHTGPLNVVGYIESNGRFQVEQKLIDMYRWLPYPETVYNEYVCDTIFYIRLKPV
jgi:hypothetical protein